MIQLVQEDCLGCLKLMFKPLHIDKTAVVSKTIELRLESANGRKNRGF
jgi:hypothetical protein